MLLAIGTRADCKAVIPERTSRSLEDASYVDMFDCVDIQSTLYYRVEICVITHKAKKEQDKANVSSFLCTIVRHLVFHYLLRYSQYPKCLFVHGGLTIVDKQSFHLQTLRITHVPPVDCF